MGHPVFVSKLEFENNLSFFSVQKMVAKTGVRKLFKFLAADDLLLIISVLFICFYSLVGLRLYYYDD